MSAEEIAAAALLPGWPRFRGEPYVREDMGTWVVKARWPESVRESDNAVATGATVQIACQKLLAWRRTFLEQIEAEKEKAHAEIPRPVHDGSASAGDGASSEPAAAADHPDPAGSGLGLASAQDQPTDQSSAANANAPVDADFSEPETPPEPPVRDAVDDSAGQAGSFGGMFVEKDEIARLIKELAVQIVYRREDLTASLKRQEGDLEEERVSIYNLPERTDEQVTRLNKIQADLAALIQRKAAIERYATNAREGLEGKTLAYLQQVDVAALSWPT